MNKRLLVTSGFGALLLSAFFITGGTAAPNAVTKIADGVWFREGDIRGEGHCNNTIIEMKDYLVVIDANFPSGARLAMADAKKVSPKPVKYVFITHHHGDHNYGAAVWTEAGATTLAYKGMAEEMGRYEPTRWQATAKSRKDVGDLKRDKPEAPKQTFDKSPYVIKDSTRELQFHFFGWAHTRGDGFAWLPKERVLATGDAGVNGAFNYTADANIGNWPKVMEAALKLKPLHVLPGHGEPGGPEILAGQGAFMTELMKAVSAEVAKGKKLEDIVTLKNGAPSATSITLSAGVQNWVGRSLPTQVSDAYREITQKQPNGAIAHQ
jgi:glyoxylase-like metal-dependent hydrolase (beta-lactamase superfamily II)